MLLRVPAATLKDLAGYADMLTRRGAPYQAVVTKIGFDPTVAHPKMTFKATRWLDADEAAKVKELMDDSVIEQITGTQRQPTVAAKPTVVQKPQAEVKKPTTTLMKPKEVEPEVEKKPAVKATGFGGPAKAPAPKEAPPPSKASAKLIEASNELDAALGELDDL
jgi:hypothetical protein